MNEIETYISALEEPRKTEIKELHALIRETVPQFEPQMQSGIIGYGQYHYKYASGREGDWYHVGLSSRKNYISLYIMAGCEGKYLPEIYKDKLPKAKIGKSCITFKKLQDIDLSVIRQMLNEAAALQES